MHDGCHMTMKTCKKVVANGKLPVPISIMWASVSNVNNLHRKMAKRRVV